MNKHAIAGGRIAGICAAGILFVVLTHLVTASAIERRGERETYRLLKEIAPAKSFSPFKIVEGAPPVLGYYSVLGKAGDKETYILSVEGTGYKGALPLFVHCAADGEILAARLLKTREYPGMGKLAEDPAYMNKFIGTGGEKPVPLTLAQLSPKNADAVSGVSVTFGGVARALEKASAFVKNGGVKK
jgi:electron transport complex protein RnfG